MTVIEGSKLEGQTVLDVLLRNETPIDGGGDWVEPAWATTPGFCSEERGWNHEAFFAGEEFAGIQWHNPVTPLASWTIVVGCRIKLEASPERWIAVWTCANQTKKNGYRLRIIIGSGGGAMGTPVLERMDEGVPTVLAEGSEQTFNPETPINIAVETDGTITVYRDWYEVLFTVTDKAYVSGYAGFEGKGFTNSALDFRYSLIEGGSSEEPGEGEEPEPPEEETPGHLVKTGSGLVKADRYVKTASGLVKT